MANLLSCQGVSKSYGAQTLFENINLVISQNDRIGLIGPNGSGKSTLLRILCGAEEHDSGKIVTQKHVVTSYLSQSDHFLEKEGAMSNLLNALEGLELDEIEKHNRVNALLSRAEFPDYEGAVELLSGGWRKRLSICRALVANPDILIMDEPTNHLDIEGILWLEGMLAGNFPESPSAYLLVSHDRQVLQNCTNRIVELSAVYPEGSLQVEGSYGKFLVEKESFIQRQNEEEVRLSNKVRRETEWLRRGPKARATKAKYRIDEAYKLQDELSQVKSRNRATSNLRIGFDSTRRKTKKLLEAFEISKKYGDKKLFSNLDIMLSPGKRIGLLGRNGCGKSSLMKILAASPDEDGSMVDSGSIKVAEKVKIVSFDQKRETIDPGVTLRRALAPDGDSIIYRDRSIHVVSWAKRFLFRVDQLETPVGRLSGGEQARILIAGLMRQQADILLLDEPTNDLDIASLDVLEESLLDFPGALVLVSHDRFLLDRVCDSLIGFDGQGSVSYYADYEQWISHMKDLEKGQNVPLKEKKEKPAPNGSARKKSGRLSYMDQREYDQMEEMIMLAEAELEELQGLIESLSNSGDAQLLHETWQKVEEQQKRVDGLYARWDELEAMKNES
jgi:ABC transport system ATP-binding/permease protein